MENLQKLVNKTKNIEIKSMFKEIKKSNDPTDRAKKLCVLSGIIAYYYHTIDNSFLSLKKTEEMAIDTCTMMLKKKSL